MTLEQFQKMSGLDRYSFNARLVPAMLTILPILLLILIWFPTVWTALGAAAALAISVGILYALAQYARYVGRAVERRMGDRAGPEHSVRLLSHSDGDIPYQQKAIIRALVERETTIVFPTLDEEIADPQKARDDYRSAMSFLLEHTRGDTMLLNENIGYGFRRNLLGLRPLGLIVVACAIALNTLFLVVFEVEPTQWKAAAILESFLFVFLVMWASVINAAFVEDASISYARRLFKAPFLKKG